jgi:hypothetical protein
LLITILRSVRADFAPEIWAGLQTTIDSSRFFRSELVVAAGVLVLNGTAVFIPDNRRAFFVGLATAIGGMCLVAAALLGLQEDMLSPFAFVVLHGMGLYLPYIAVHTTIFERLIAMTRERGNMGFLMYLADAFGYLGYVAVVLARFVVGPAENFLPYFVALSWLTVGTSLVLMIPCWRCFASYAATERNAAPTIPEPEPVGGG